VVLGIRRFNNGKPRTLSIMQMYIKVVLQFVNLIYEIWINGWLKKQARGKVYLWTIYLSKVWIRIIWNWGLEKIWVIDSWAIVSGAVKEISRISANVLATTANTSTSVVKAMKLAQVALIHLNGVAITDLLWVSFKCSRFLENIKKGKMLILLCNSIIPLT